MVRTKGEGRKEVGRSGGRKEVGRSGGRKEVGRSGGSTVDVEARAFLKEKLNTMNIGDIAEDDFESLVEEISRDPEVEVIGPSFASVLFSDLLTLVIFSTALYMIIIYVMNYFTGELLM
jgi:preprotein translocase subunit SecF